MKAPGRSAGDMGKKTCGQRFTSTLALAFYHSTVQRAFIPHQEVSLVHPTHAFFTELEVEMVQQLPNDQPYFMIGHTDKTLASLLPI